jgi:hypothetical protein
MPIFKSPNSFSQNFKKKTPFRKEEIISIEPKKVELMPVDTKEPELAKATKWEDTEAGKKQAAKAEKKAKRKEFWKKAKTKADEIGMEMLTRPTQADPYL